MILQSYRSAGVQRKHIAALGPGLVSALFLTACSSPLSSADKAKAAALEAFCAVKGNANISICKVNDRVNKALAVAQDANANAKTANVTANRALEAAGRAQITADSAMAGTGLQCETVTFKSQSVGTCQPGYTLLSCHQSRYTARDGRPSILRDIDNEQCEFATPVLEMKVRCCLGAAVSEIVKRDPAPKTPIPPQKKRKKTNRTS